MNDGPLITFQIVCRHGEVRITIRTDRPAIPTGTVAVLDVERPDCAPHLVRRVLDVEA